MTPFLAWTKGHNMSIDIHDITTTHCCCCRAKLEDSMSIERGIGPVCSRRHYKADRIPTDKDVQATLGLLQASHLPGEIVDGFLKVVNNKRRNARLGCNLLIKWASRNYQDRDVIFKCSKIIRALGYTELADKLEVDRTVARIEDKGDYLLVYVSNQWKLKRDLARIPGADPILDDSEHEPKLGHKVGWKIPVKQEDYFLVVLGFHFGGKMLCSTKGVWRIEQASWRDLQEYRHPRNPHQAAPGGCLLRDVRGAYEVFTPYSESFKDELKRQVPYRDRKWTGKCWKVAARYVDVVKGLVESHFGVVV